MSAWSSPNEEARAVRLAAARARCRVEALGVRETLAGPRAVGRVSCPDGWAAARVLLALAVEDSKTAGARDLALRLRAQAPSDDAFARLVHRYVLEGVRFVREPGEVFAGASYTLAAGAGDCDDHARVIYALLRAGGLPARLAFLYQRGASGPSHVVVQANVGGEWAWMETTIPAAFGEHPYAAGRRVGVLSDRTDIATEVRTMTEKDLAPVPADFDVRNPDVAADARALEALGFLCDAAGISGASDPRFRAGVAAFQRTRGLVVDGLIGPATRQTLGDIVTASSPHAVGAPEGRLLGLDISAAQGPSVDFAAAREAGFAFVIVKLSEGLHLDSFARRNIAEARKAGFLVSVYHFATMLNAPEAEAQFFAAHAKELGPFDFPPCFDFEAVDANDHPRLGDGAVDWAARWVRVAKAELGASTILLYSYPSYLKELEKPLLASELPRETLLWLADYSGGETPAATYVPLTFNPGARQWFLEGGWPTWTMMQTVGNKSSRVPGFPAAVDHDVFRGSADDLRALGRPGGGALVASAGAVVGLLVLAGLAAAAVKLAWRG